MPFLMTVMYSNQVKVAVHLDCWIISVQKYRLRANIKKTYSEEKLTATTPESTTLAIQ